MRASVGMNVQVFRGGDKPQAGLIVDIVNQGESMVSCVAFDVSGAQSLTGNIKFCAADEPKPATDYCAEVREQESGSAPKTR